MPCEVWDEITYPFLNFNGCTVEDYVKGATGDYCWYFHPYSYHPCYITAIHFKIRYQQKIYWYSILIWVAVTWINELIKYQFSNPGNGHQGGFSAIRVFYWKLSPMPLATAIHKLHVEFHRDYNNESTDWRFHTIFWHRTSVMSTGPMD